MRLGIDVGGTFTDLVAIDDRGVATLAKVPSTPDDPSRGVLDGLERLAETLAVSTADLLRATSRIVHGTTVATNALIEGKGARTGMLVTAGHRDVVEMREGLKPVERYNMRMPPPAQLVPRALRLPVVERMRHDGRVEVPLDAESLEQAIAALRAAEVEAVAVCFLHAWRDPRHEQIAAQAVCRALPDAYVALSSQVLPKIKEFERFSTTAVNAYVGPRLARYLERLGERLKRAGYAGPVLIMQSHGGVLPIAEAIRLAAGAVLSGPAGGVAGSRHAGKLVGELNLIPFDMGGTSTDISLIVDGTSNLAVDRTVAGQRVALDSLDIVSIGAGGGSIARVDAGGILHVGPQSAGADPGPACYGLGGTGATVTDANVVLGLIDPENFLGGRRLLDRAAAAAAVDRIAAALGIAREAAAYGIHRVVDTTMAEGVRLVSVRRGVDPRKFALFAFGGASGLHATAVAHQLGLARVIVPRVAAVLSAWGMLATDLRFELAQSHVGDLSRLDEDEIARMFTAMEADGAKRLRASFEGKVRCDRSVDMRYGEQVFEINVPLSGVDWRDQPLAQIVERFHRRHEELYTYAQRDQEAVLVNLRVAVVGVLPGLPQEPALAPAPPSPPEGERRIYLDEFLTAPVYAFDRLAPGQSIDGPAIVESAMTTILLRPRERAVTTPNGWLDIALPESAQF
ncbi:MAG TPA: hydantoinase/oxoprolinase family protein [Xanthobacteraceae bacterium]|nr:hydantoinase/oxoprolinase family protein [Xanthobacteraceae bacterium]